MFDSPVEEIKNRLDIVEVIGSYIKLQKAGANYRAICPFHSEKRPSFFVSPSRQMWHCFGSCSEGGDIFKFIMKIEGVEFPEALKILAQRAGVELKTINPKLRTEKQRLLEICQLAVIFFTKQLESRSGQQAKKYLLDRGISEESIQKFKIGYAPDVWQGLSDFLISRGYRKEEIVKAGLAVPKNEKIYDIFDRFRARIMFPIFDLNSQPVGFTGRIFGDSKEVAKYVNTPGTLLYDKSRILYGLDKAKTAIRKEDRCVLVEGQTDVIMSHQAGVENVAATSGTALTSFQLAVLKRYSQNLVTAFDMDIAGDSATRRGIGLAQSQGFNIKVVEMPGEKDPADVVAGDPQEWKKLVENAKSIMDFYFDTAFLRHDHEKAEGKREISGLLLPKIKKIPNKIEQAYWIKELSKRLEINEQDIRNQLELTKDEEIMGYSFGQKKADNQNSVSKSRKELLEERIISLILESPHNLEIICQGDYKSFFSPRSKQVLKEIKKESNFFNREDISPELKNSLNRLCFLREIEEIDIEPEEELEICLREIQSLETKSELIKLSQEIKKAEKEKDSGKLESLIDKFKNITQKLN